MACKKPTEFSGRIDFSQEWPGADIQRVWPSDAGENAAYAVDADLGDWHLTGDICLGRDATSAIPLHLAYALSGRDTASQNHGFVYGTPDRPETFPVTGNVEHSHIVPTSGTFGNYAKITVSISDYTETSNTVSFEFSITATKLINIGDHGEAKRACVIIEGTW